MNSFIQSLTRQLRQFQDETVWLSYHTVSEMVNAALSESNTSIVPATFVKAARDFDKKRVGFTKLRDEIHLCRELPQFPIDTAEKQRHANNPRPLDPEDDPRDHPGYEP